MKTWSELTRDDLRRMIVEQQRKISELQDINKLFMADLKLKAAIEHMRVLRAQLRIAMEVKIL